MNYPFHKAGNPRNSKRLFLPVNDFTFSTFTVPMKFRQPTSGVAKPRPVAKPRSLPTTVSATATLNYLKRLMR